MAINTKKRNLELSAGIVGVVIGGLTAISMLFIIISWLFAFINELTYRVSPTYYNPLPLLVLWGVILLVVFGFTVALIILCAMLIKSPYTEKGVKGRTVLRITVIIISFLCGYWVVGGLMVAVISMNDYVPAAVAVKNVQQDFNAKISELKMLKQSGVIDEEVYSAAVNKLVDKIE